MGNFFEAHVDYCTAQIVNWLQSGHEHFIADRVAQIREQNILEGRDHTTDEDAEHLASILEDYAMEEFRDGFAQIERGTTRNTIEAFVTDAISEVDWAELALDYLVNEAE